MLPQTLFGCSALLENIFSNKKKSQLEIKSDISHKDYESVL